MVSPDRARSRHRPRNDPRLFGGTTPFFQTGDVKAAELHLARCLALECAPAAIRVNVVNPDAVLRGSKIWAGEWLEQRASTYKTDKEGLEEMYRQRSMLKRSVLPEGSPQLERSRGWQAGGEAPIDTMWNAA